MALRVIRESQGLSLRQVAEKSGTSASYLAQVERGDRVPTDRWMRAVKSALAESMKEAS